MALRLRLIGLMEAWTLNNESVLPLGRKTRALLAILALSAPRPVMRARLAELLWSRRPEEQARASLRQEIHRLLEALQPAGNDVLRVSREYLSLRADRVWIDVGQVLRATQHDPASLALLDGELLKEFDGIDPAFDQWLASERERLRDGARAVAESVLSGQAEPDTVIPAAQQLLGIDHAHEGAWRALMRAHAERGEQRLAIQAFDRCKSTLSNLLDATPSAETERLAADIQSGALVAAEVLSAHLPRTEPRSATRAGAKLGVLPLCMLGTGEDEAHLSLGLAEEITSALAQFRWLSLVSSSSLAQFGNRDEAALQRTFDLDFLIDGNVQRAGPRLRVTIRLIDLREGSEVVWAQHFDRQTDDLLGLQDDVAAEAAAQIDPEILLIESRRVTRRPQTNPTAYDLVLRALPLIVRLQRDEFIEAGVLLERALALEPDYATAHAWRAYWAMFCVSQGWTEQSGALEIAGRHAERAVTLDPQDARGLTIAGHVRAFLHRKPREALELHSRALSLNSNLAMAWGLSATTYAYLGNAEEATQRFDRYKRLAPTDANAFFFDACMIIPELVRRDYEAAVLVGRRASELGPHFSAGLKYYLVALGHVGRMDEAARIRTRLLTIEPGFTVQSFLARAPFERPADLDCCAAGLRLAGISEGPTPL